MATTPRSKTSKTGKTTTTRKATSAGRRRSGTATGSPKATVADTPVATSDTPIQPPVQEISMTEMTNDDMPSGDVIEANAADGSGAASGDGASGDGASDDRLRRTDLIGAIAARVSLKRSEAKMVFDVVLDEIGKALDVSDEVVVPPLGKLMVKKRDMKPGGSMLTLKLKRAEEAPAAGDVSRGAEAPLAEPGEDG